MYEVKALTNINHIVELVGRFHDVLKPEIAMSLNRANHGIKTDTNRHLRKTRHVKTKELKDWGFHDATSTDLDANAIVRGLRIPFIEYMPTAKLQNMDGRNNKGGVDVKIKGKVQHFRHGFTHDLKTGKMGVRQRKPGARDLPKHSKKGARLWGRFPLKHLKIPSVPQMADDDDSVKVIQAGAVERFDKQFRHQMKRLIQDYA